MKYKTMQEIETRKAQILEEMNQEGADLEALKNSDSIYKCLSCFACIDRCPRGVEPAKVVEAVRLAAVRRQGANRMTANDVPAMIEEDTPQQLLVSAFRKYTK